MYAEISFHEFYNSLPNFLIQIFFEKLFFYSRHLPTPRLAHKSSFWARSAIVRQTRKPSERLWESLNHTHTHDLHPRPTTHDLRHLATLPVIGERKCRLCLADIRGGEMNAWQTNPKGRLRGGYTFICPHKFAWLLAVFPLDNNMLDSVRGLGLDVRWYQMRQMHAQGSWLECLNGQQDGMEESCDLISDNK